MNRVTKRFSCPYCGRGSVGCPSRGQCISDDEKQRLMQFIVVHGVKWRAALRREWDRGADTLRQVRNIVGPSQLSKVNPRQFPVAKEK